MISLFTDGDGFVEIGNDEQVVLSYEELEVLTGSKKIIDVLKSRAEFGTVIIRRGTNNRLELMDYRFILHEEYIHIESGIKYRCVKVDTVTNEAAMRPLVKRGKRDLLLATSVDGWMINR